MIAARKISTADRALEKHISYPGQLLALVQEYHVARRVARAMEDLEGLLSDCDRIPIFQPAIRQQRR